MANNGSKDDSVLIVERLRAHVVQIGKKGNGNAVRGGIQAASGKWIVMGDADESYDFSNTDRISAAIAATQTLWGDGCRRHRLFLLGEAGPNSATRVVRQVRIFGKFSQSIFHFWRKPTPITMGIGWPNPVAIVVIPNLHDIV